MSRHNSVVSASEAVAPFTVALEEVSTNTQAYQLDTVCSICSQHFGALKTQRVYW